MLRLLIILFLIGLSVGVFAQELPGHKPIVLEKVIIGKDTLPMIVLEPVDIVERRNEIIVPDKLKKYVRTVYPYALRTARILEQIDGELAQMEKNKQKKVYLKSTEKLLRKTFESDIRNLTRNQGKILTKLIYRETGRTVYSLIADYRNGLTAGWWNFAGKFYDQSLKMEFHPESDEEDRIIEQYVQYLDAVYQRTGYTQTIQKEHINTVIPKTNKQVRQERKAGRK